MLYRVVVAQALYSVLGGWLIAVGFTLALTIAVPRLVPALTLAIAPASLLKVAVTSLAIAMLASMLPIRQIASLDPAAVFRGG